MFQFHSRRRASSANVVPAPWPGPHVTG